MAVLPVYNMVAVPESSIFIKASFYRDIIGRNPMAGAFVTFVFLKRDTELRDITRNDFYPIGITGVITEANNNGYMMIKLEDRVDINDLRILPDGTIDVDASVRLDIDDLDIEDEKVKVAALKEEIIEFSKGYQWGEIMRNYAGAWEHMGDVAAAMSPWISAGAEEKFAVLAEDSKQKRYEMMEKMVFESLEMAKVQNMARSAQEEDYQKLYRESAIRKQIEYLQKELDELHPEEMSDLRKLELTIEESGMNEDAKKECRKVLNRLKNENQNSAESGLLRDYLDLITTMPWDKEEQKDIDLDKAEEILDRDHFGLSKVKRRIIEQIAVMNLKKQQSGSILLFVGAPGTGKTSIGKSIAEALGRKYVRVSLGGVRDEADIRGHRRTYIGSMPGRIIDGIHKCGVSNPVMVLDEVDKLSQSYNGDPASALLEVLDPEQNNTFTDHYLNVPYDLSDVFFICTANSVDTIPEPLLNRMEMIQFRGYTPIEKMEIAKRHLIPKSMEAVGITEGNLTISDDAIDLIISDYTRESGVRGLKKRIDTICRSAAVNLVRNKKDTLTVSRDDVKEFIDINPLHHKKVKDETTPGIVTGLAWTQVGGEILYIETMLTGGKGGNVIITGQLGDIMRESAEIAISLVKSMYPDKAELFEKKDLHIHVPDGSTPKDGPSAGITLTTALSSLVNGIPVTPHIAMTGEVSLQGYVNPIGGLPEKLMAAQRAGVTKVFIPEDNMDDLKDVDKEVVESLEIVPVKTVRELLASVKLYDEEEE